MKKEKETEFKQQQSSAVLKKQEEPSRPVSKHNNNLNNYPGARYYSPQHNMELKNPVSNQRPNINAGGKEGTEFPALVDRPKSKIENRKKYAKSPEEPPVHSRASLIAP